jgi:hypothetical protein
VNLAEIAASSKSPADPETAHGGVREYAVIAEHAASGAAAADARVVRDTVDAGARRSRRGRSHPARCHAQPAPGGDQMTRTTFVSLCAIVLGLAAPPRRSWRRRVRRISRVWIRRECRRCAGALAAGAEPVAGPAPAAGQTPARHVRRLHRRRPPGVEPAHPLRRRRGNTLPDRAEFFYGKCACYRGLAVAAPALFDPDAPGPGPGASTDISFQQLYLEGEFQVAPQLSVLGQVPVRWLQPNAFVAGTGDPFSNQSGFGDIRVGAKLAFVDTAATIASVKVQFYFPSGDASKGLGTDHVSWEPALLLWNELSPRVNLESQLGVWLPVGGSAPVPTAADGHFAGRVFYYGIGPSFTVYDNGGTRVAPVVELVGWHVMSGNQTPADLANFDASGTNIVNLKIGARFVVDRGSFYAGYGHALTDAAWYTDIIRFEYRYSF